MTSSEPQVVVSPAAEADLPAIEALLTLTKLPLAGVAHHLDEFLLARRGEQVVAVAAVERHGQHGLLRSVAVHPQARGAGLADSLTRRLIADSRAQGLRSLSLLTTTAEQYFPRFGFRRVERSELPQSLNASEEFQGACPASSAALHLPLI